MHIYRALIVYYLLIGCTSKVHVSLNSISSPALSDKILNFSFIRKSPEIEHEKLLRECESGASAAGKAVLKECTNDCLLVDVEGQTGSSRELTDSYYDPNSKTTKVYSYTETDRKIKIKMFEPKNSSKAIYQVIIDSAGSGRNVLSVASEMCEAAFTVFPKEVTAKEIQIKAK